MVRCNIVTNEVRTERIHENAVYQIYLESYPAEEGESLAYDDEDGVLRVLGGCLERDVVAKKCECRGRYHLQEHDRAVDHAVVEKTF